MHSGTFFDNGKAVMCIRGYVNELNEDQLSRLSRNLLIGSSGGLNKLSRRGRWDQGSKRRVRL
jgi:hypothetical protein